MTILLVEDNPADVRLAKELLADLAVPNNVVVAWDGDQALAAVRGQEGARTTARPDLVLLDLNLPRTSGREVLEQLKADQELRCIPVIILTTSTAESDVRYAYQHHANAYVNKPANLDEFLIVVQAIEQFWINVARFPT
jgi:CheY-like chemotaxis protein